MTTFYELNYPIDFGNGVLLCRGDIVFAPSLEKEDAYEKALSYFLVVKLFNDTGYTHHSPSSITDVRLAIGALIVIRNTFPDQFWAAYREYR